jgi:RNA polymerase sigma factor (sigma-70 family)
MPPPKKIRVRYQVATCGNIPAVKTYNPFPRTGLVAEHEQFIRGYVRNWCGSRRRWGEYEEILNEAVLIATIAVQKYDPQGGASFKTFLTYHFKGLGRRTNYLKQILAGQPPWKPSDDKEKTDENGNVVPEEDRESLKSVGRLRQYQRNWWEPEKPIRQVFKRKGEKIAVEIQPFSRLKEWSDFARPIQRGYARGVLRQIVNGVLKSGADLEQIRHAVKGHFNGCGVEASINVYEVPPPKLNLKPGSDLEDRFLNAASVVRPSLSANEKAVLDWRLASLAGLDERSLTEVANSQGITKGAASKIRDRVEDKLRARMYAKSQIAEKYFRK